MRKEEAKFETRFLSEAGTKGKNNDYFGYTQLDNYAIWVVADGYDEEAGADVANRNYHVGDSDFNMVLAKGSLTTNAASSISQIVNSISESAENISNNAKIYLETIRDEKIVTANNILQIAQENMSIQSNGDTQINSDGVSVLNGGNDVLINK